MAWFGERGTHTLVGIWKVKPLPCSEEGFSKAKGETPNIKSACFEAKVAVPPSRSIADGKKRAHLIKETDVKQRRTDNLLKTFDMKRKIRIAFCNVRAKMESGKLIQVKRWRNID